MFILYHTLYVEQKYCHCTNQMSVIHMSVINNLPQPSPDWSLQSVKDIHPSSLVLLHWLAEKLTFEKPAC